MAESHLILLPKENYFKWVRAAQKYALSFGVSITPDPHKAGGSQTVTVAVPKKGYPEAGDITIWLKARFPDTAVDAIYAETPDELKLILDARAEADQRFGEEDAAAADVILPKFPPDRLYLFWPTDNAAITQRFGANPEIYARWDLFGHEGLDIRAPHGANIYACADGEVVVVERNPAAHAYGKHIRIRHQGGYKTVYGHLNDVLVEVGQQVFARELIGRAASSGIVGGSHLHLTLKKEGATERGETDFPGDILDPTPFMVFPHQEAEVLSALGRTLPPFPQPTYPWAQPCLVGVNGRVGGTMQEVDLSILRSARIEAVKLPANTPTGTISRLRQLIPELFISARVTLPLQEKVTAAACLDAVRPDVERLYDLGLRFFEVHQSPNLHSSGQELGWRSGGEFADLWLEVIGSLRTGLPEARFGFPGLSPGGQVTGQRLDAGVFLDQADSALLAADWIGVNCFWTTETGMHAETGGLYYRNYRQRYPEKLLFITEFGSLNPHAGAYVKGQQYLQYYQKLRSEPGIGAAFAQVISASGSYANLAWRSEDGKINQIPKILGGRSF